MFAKIYSGTVTPELFEAPDLIYQELDLTILAPRRTQEKTINDLIQLMTENNQGVSIIEELENKISEQQAFIDQLTDTNNDKIGNFRQIIGNIDTQDTEQYFTSIRELSNLLLNWTFDKSWTG